MLSPLRRVGLAAALALATVSAAAATAAAAGEYDVSVCRHADGSVAPTDGWQLATQDDFHLNDRATNSCAVGGRIDLELSSDSLHGHNLGSSYAGAQLSFFATPPPATAWRQAEVWWAYASNPAGPSGGAEQIAGSVAGAPQATCSWVSACSSRGTFSGPPLAVLNRSLVPIAAAQSTAPLVVTVLCSSAPSACPSVSGEPYALLRAWRLRVTLAEASAPVFTAQPALPATAHDGLPVSISATDSGSGVHTAQLVVDGAPAGSPRVVDEAGGRCVKQADGTFGYQVPCSLSLSSAPVTLDTASLANGTHSIAVQIADAAGNTTVSTARSVTVANSVPLAQIPADNPLRGQGHVHNGSGSAAAGTVMTGLRRGGTGRLRTKLHVRSGRRARLAGRLVADDGKPVGSALLSVTTTRPGTAPRHFTVRTRANGTYTRTLRWGPTRRIVVKWYPWGDSTAPIQSRTVRLLGLARVTLGVSPQRPRNGNALHFTGRVAGAPKGARVTIQVRVGRLWRTFLLPAVNAKGRYRGRRTLLHSAGVSYCLRARVLSQPDFAYAAGSSRQVCLRVR